MKLQLQHDKDLTESIRGLEKDVFYYRNANKELKTKLREVVAVNHKLAHTLEKQKSIPSFPVAVEHK